MVYIPVSNYLHPEGPSTNILKFYIYKNSWKCLLKYITYAWIKNKNKKVQKLLSSALMLFFVRLKLC